MHRHPDTDRCPGLPLLRGEAGRLELRSTARAARQAVVDPGNVRRDPLAGVFLEIREALLGCVGEAGLAGEYVPVDSFLTEEGGRRPEQAAALELDLPGAIGRHVEPLEVGEGERIAGLQVRYPEGVPVDLGVHSSSSLF